MSKKNDSSMLAVWVLCGIFFFAVVISAVADIPDITLNADRLSAETTTTMDEAFGKININTALKEELMTLPGIGETIALRIITYREENGPFTCIEDLMNVKGIGEKTWEKLRDLITV